MIIDTMENAARYRGLGSTMAAAIDFLLGADLRDLSLGRHEIDGDHVYAVAMRSAGRSRDEAKLETHRRYIDLQVVLDGVDEMGWLPVSLCDEPRGTYDAERDLQFYDDEPSVWLPVRVGQFAVFFPEDAHAPMVAVGEIHKIVIKIAVEN